MTFKNTFIPKTILPSYHDLKIEAFSMRDFSEVDSAEAYKIFMADLKEWAKSPAQLVQIDKPFLKVQKAEEIPLFIVEMILRNNDERIFSVRILTNLDLFEYISRRDEEVKWHEIFRKMELKGVP